MTDPLTTSAFAHKQLQEAQRLFTQGLLVLGEVSSADLAGCFAEVQRDTMTKMLEPMMAHAHGRAIETLMWIGNIANQTAPPYSEPNDDD